MQIERKIAINWERVVGEQEGIRCVTEPSAESADMPIMQYNSLKHLPVNNGSVSTHSPLQTCI